MPERAATHWYLHLHQEEASEDEPLNRPAGHVRQRRRPRWSRHHWARRRSQRRREAGHDLRRHREPVRKVQHLQHPALPGLVLLMHQLRVGFDATGSQVRRGKAATARVDMASKEQCPRAQDQVN